MINESYLPDPKTLKASGSDQERLHQQAAETAREQFGRRVFLRGVIELSNYCRENCVYCGMRRDNRGLNRYRVHHEKIADWLIHHRPAAITDLNIQTGEDPVATRKQVLPLVKTLRRETSLGISVCLGTLNPELYAELQKAGASIYIMKFESGDPEHYRQMQAPGRLEERVEHIRRLKADGWFVSSGFIVGLPGQGERQLQANFDLAGRLPLDGCSVSPFIPGESTPLGNHPPAGIDLTLNAMALLRLMHPDWVIPAVSALNLAEPMQGYRRGLRTGANLVTMNLTPPELREDYLLYRRDRFIMTEDRILSVIDQEGLSPSSVSLSDYYQAKAIKAADRA